ncbi:MAG TPA: arylsulfotransferase family protein [Solirubrobacteraceae bacterium]|nr:arylsulfotransferase family protein [Solirubrobacteraceae bacterium]
MNRNRLLLATLIAAAAIAVAVVLATGVLSGAGKKARVASSPSCLPSTLNHSAQLAGLPVDVSPAPETDTANPRTQISFLGVPSAEIREVSVVGQRSGAHTGQLRSYSQGDGASFLPSTPFDAGERVTVSATIDTGQPEASASSQARATASEKRVSFAFRVDTPYSTAGAPPFPNPQATPADYQSFDTLPGTQAPVLSVTVPDRDPSAGDILTTNGPGPGQYGPLIYTPKGRLVWFDRLPKGETAEDLNVQSYEGQRDLTFWHGKVLSLGFGQGEDVVLNSHYQAVARVAGGNGLQADLHDFQIVPNGISYTTAFNAIRCNLSPLGGARDGVILDTAVQEIDMKTGLVRWEWHSLDHVAASESETETPKTATPWDWFHINSIDVEGGEANQSGNVFISARSTWAGYQLQGGSGNILWRLGGLKSSFKMGPGTETAWQHDGRILSNGDVTFFDDGSNPPIHRQSRGLRIVLDFKTHQARLLAAYTHPSPPLLAPSQGNMQTLADGNAVVGYGGVPAISEFAPGGSLLFDAHLPLDMSFYRAYRFPWSGRPTSPPAALVNLNDTGEDTIVHMSWNGATEVASWRVLAGERPETLTARATIPASEFESSTVLPKKYAYAQVQALDSAGHVLGTSKPTKLTTYAAALPSAGQSQ